MSPSRKTLTELNEEIIKEEEPDSSCGGPSSISQLSNIKKRLRSSPTSKNDKEIASPPTKSMRISDKSLESRDGDVFEDGNDNLFESLELPENDLTEKSQKSASSNSSHVNSSKSRTGKRKLSEANENESPNVSSNSPRAKKSAIVTECFENTSEVADTCFEDDEDVFNFEGVEIEALDKQKNESPRKQLEKSPTKIGIVRETQKTPPKTKTIRRLTEQDREMSLDDDSDQNVAVITKSGDGFRNTTMINKVDTIS